MGNVNAIRRAGALRLALVAALAGGVLAACALPQPYPELQRLGVSTQITSRNLCGLGVSPPISISGAPPATTQYRLRLTNIDVLFDQPWETTVQAVPGGFGEGAIADYEAPCVGDLEVYASYRYQTYQLEVMALDANSRPLAYGRVNLAVQSISATLDRERAAQRPSTARPNALQTRPGPLPGWSNNAGQRVNPGIIPQPFDPLAQP
jgi:hypothetical protein